MAAERRLTPWMLGVGGVPFLAGLLFGYDAAEMARRWIRGRFVSTYRTAGSCTATGCSGTGHE